MRFFDSNFSARYQGGAVDQSSGLGWNAFNENSLFPYVSTGQDTDGDSVWIDRELVADTIITRIFISKTNIANLVIKYMKDGDSSYTTLLASQYDLTTSEDGTGFLFNIKTNITLNKLRLEGANTTPANEEKMLENIYLFNEIGEIKIFKKIIPERERNQKRLKLDSGGSVIVNKGYGWKISLTLDANNQASDVETFNKLRNSEKNFFVWINDNSEFAFNVYQDGYNFGDLIKVGAFGKSKFEYTDNYFGHGIKDKLTMYEAGKTA